MRSLTLLIVVAGFLAVALLCVPAVQAADKAASQSQEQWRYTFHNGEWWYWLPSNRWVYWRNDRWNDYKPQTYVSPRAVGSVATVQNGWNYENQTASDSDIGPFYGRTTGAFDNRAQEPSGEVGPFYGHALPSEVFGIKRIGNSDVGPFYGRTNWPYGK
jgi:hypothetical protein